MYSKVIIQNTFLNTAIKVQAMSVVRIMLNVATIIFRSKTITTILQTQFYSNSKPHVFTFTLLTAWNQIQN